MLAKYVSENQKRASLMLRLGLGKGIVFWLEKCGFVVTNEAGTVLTSHQKDLVLLPQTGRKEIQYSHTYKCFLTHVSCHHHAL